MMCKTNWLPVLLGMLMLFSGFATHAQELIPVAGNQQTSSASVAPAVNAPRLVKFGGVLKDGSGLLRSGVVGLTFAIYKDQQGGNSLWLETQNVEADAQGNYSVLLGATQSEGLPLELFTTGESRWLGVQVQLPGEVEQPRVLLTSVPYALKAADAETLGGLPVSAFLLANPDLSTGGSSGISTQAVSPNASGRSIFFHTANANTGGTGTANQMTKWLNNTGTLTDSAVFESGGNVGIGTSNPASQLDIENFGAANDATKEIMRFGGGTDPTLGPMVLAFEANPSSTGSNRFFALDTGDNLSVRNLILLPKGGANVGIGTTSPSQKLEVNGSVQVDGKLGIGTSTPASQLDIENFGAANDATKEIMRFGGGTDPTLGPMVLAFEANPSATGSNRFFALDTGDNLAVRNLILLPKSGANVGIGTTSPTHQLEVNGTAKVTALMFPDNSTMNTAVTLGANTYTGVQMGTGFTASSNSGTPLSGTNSGTGGGTVAVQGTASAIGPSAGATIGVQGITNSSTNSAAGVVGIASAPGSNGGVTFGVEGITNSGAAGAAGVFGLANSTSAYAGLFNNQASGNILVGQAAGVNVFRVDGTGKGFFNGGIQLNTANAKPTCDATVRGAFWVTQGGTGVKDSVEVCAKDVSDSYAWRTIY